MWKTFVNKVLYLSPHWSVAIGHSKDFVTSFLAHLMSQKSFELVLNEEDVAFGSEGLNV